MSCPIFLDIISGASFSNHCFSLFGHLFTTAVVLLLLLLSAAAAVFNAFKPFLQIIWLLCWSDDVLIVLVN